MDYDNTDRGSFFKPRADESLLVQGKLNSEGSEYRVAIVKASLPDGGTARDVYVKVGTMYENDKSLNEFSLSVEKYINASISGKVIKKTYIPDIL